MFIILSIVIIIITWNVKKSSPSRQILQRMLAQRHSFSTSYTFRESNRGRYV